MHNLDLKDFHCRFMILENAACDMIGTIEAALIRCYTPVWNSSIDGFGNHDPGKGRYNPNQIGTYCIQDGVGLISAKVRLCLWLM